MKAMLALKEPVTQGLHIMAHPVVYPKLKFRWNGDVLHCIGIRRAGQRWIWASPGLSKQCNIIDHDY